MLDISIGSELKKILVPYVEDCFVLLFPSANVKVPSLQLKTVQSIRADIGHRALLQTGLGWLQCLRNCCLQLFWSAAAAAADVKITAP